MKHYKYLIIGGLPNHLRALTEQAGGSCKRVDDAERSVQYRGFKRERSNEFTNTENLLS
jgi:hypothetical protein